MADLIQRFLNIGICLDQVAFDYTPQMVGGEVQVALDSREGEDALIHFCIRLFHQFQAIGTVPAVDMTKYEATVFPMQVDHDTETNG